MGKTVLMVLTSHGELGDTGKKTGFWLEELATPYYALRDGGYEVMLASPAGGRPPLDPKSAEPDAQTASTRRFEDDTEAQAALESTRALAEIDPSDYAAVFFPGGHGPMWDLASDGTTASLIGRFYTAGKPVAAVCHGPAALTAAVDADGEPIVKGRKVTGFTNTEESAVELTEVVPFLLEDRLKELGGEFTRGADWEAHVVTDGILVTGQNPASSEASAKALMALLV